MLDYDLRDRIRAFYENCANGLAYQTFGYIGETDWLSVVRDQYGNIVQRYLYANGRPLRMDNPSHYQKPSYYLRYNARGDAAASVQQNGDGGAGWTQFGAW
jgi:hypothetical protein